MHRHNFLSYSIEIFTTLSQVQCHWYSSIQCGSKSLNFEDTLKKISMAGAFFLYKTKASNLLLFFQSVLSYHHRNWT